MPTPAVLASWKEVAQYLGKGVRTVQRWEHAGLPVHRPAATNKGTVLAYPEELSAWIHRRSGIGHGNSNGAERRCQELVGQALRLAASYAELRAEQRQLREELRQLKTETKRLHKRIKEQRQKLADSSEPTELLPVKTERRAFEYRTTRAEFDTDRSEGCCHILPNRGNSYPHFASSRPPSDDREGEKGDRVRRTTPREEQQSIRDSSRSPEGTDSPAQETF